MDNINKLLGNLRELITEGDIVEAKAAQKAWLSVGSDRHFYVSNFEQFQNVLNFLYINDSIICERFSRNTFYKQTENYIINLKKQNISISEEVSRKFISIFKDIMPQKYKVIAPICGIRFDKDNKSLKFGPFELGYMKDLAIPVSSVGDMYISIYVDNVYDKEVSFEIANTAFSDFIRILHFFLGRFDNSHVIKCGLPVLPSVSHEEMYVETTSFGTIDINGNFDSTSIKSKYVEKIPVDHEFFLAHSKLGKILTLYEKAYNNYKITPIEMRYLNASLSIGESAQSTDDRNSLLYACIATETLISFNESSLYQQSIGEKLATTLAFIAGKDKESRICIMKLVKDVYSMRSGIVHGGNKKITNKYIDLNVLLRAAIGEMLNSPLKNGLWSQRERATGKIRPSGGNFSAGLAKSRFR